MKNCLNVALTEILKQKHINFVSYAKSYYFHPKNYQNNTQNKLNYDHKTRNSGRLATKIHGNTA
jgi:hypothetical protein